MIGGTRPAVARDAGVPYVRHVVGVPGDSGSAVRISSTSHRVEVVAENRADVVVEGDARVERDGSMTTVDSVRSRLVVRVPEGTDLQIGTTSARVEVEGPVGPAAVVTESGRVTVAEAASADVRTNSARVEVGRVDGECCVRTSSGKVEVARCGAADVTTDSGRIVVRRAGVPVRSHCVCGRVEIALEEPADVDAETVSGRIEVQVPAGVDVRWANDQGAVASWPDGRRCRVDARSTSGAIDVSTR